MLDSIVNFRDFGNLPSRFGGSVVRDRLFRSGAVGTVRDGDAKTLQDLDFALIVDLRYAGEREDEPSRWPPAEADRVIFHDGAHSVEAPHLTPLRSGVLDEDGSDRIYGEVYRDLPFDPYYPSLIAQALHRLLAIDGRLLVHCSAGKDRTGMVTALILHVLGVSREAIMADYLRSSQAPGLLAMAEPAAQRLSERFGVTIRIELMRHLLDVKAHYLEAFFDAIEQRCGSIDAYLDTLGFAEGDCEALRRKLLVV